MNFDAIVSGYQQKKAQAKAEKAKYDGFCAFFETPQDPAIPSSLSQHQLQLCAVYRQESRKKEKLIAKCDEILALLDTCPQEIKDCLTKCSGHFDIEGMEDQVEVIYIQGAKAQEMGFMDCASELCMCREQFPVEVQLPMFRVLVKSFIQKVGDPRRL